ncbi:hypothetical protein [Skermanella stibiiresistens]|uniref:hypothetical protein n=1 Tax=Skermanella stibiiresistens TaxID=913326 RepID=UPI0009FE988A|nr:hypothetical protein [Skermanella stibiiresistens]
MAEPVTHGSRGRVRGERLETRVTAEQKNPIERAAIVSLDVVGQPDQFGGTLRRLTGRIIGRS